MSFGMPTIAQLQAVGGQAPMDLPKELRRKGEQTFWSTQSYTDGATLAGVVSKIFSTPIGQVGQGFSSALSRAETNMDVGGYISGGLAFAVNAVSAYPYYSAAAGQRQISRADVANFVNNCVLQWVFLNTYIDIAPGELVGAGGGIFGATADTGALEGGAGGSRFAFNNGNGQLWGYQYNPVLLPATTAFGINLIWGDLASVVDGGLGNNNMLIRVGLVGQFQTAVPVA